jgi:hypothetical protein
MEKRFDISRMVNFIKRQTALNASSTMIGALATFGALLVVSGIYGYFFPHAVTTLIHIYLVTFYIVILVFTSKIFDELHNPQKGYAYLTLPVSTAEKLWGSWILSAPVFTVLFSGICIVLYFLACLMGGRMEAFHKIFDLDNIEGVGIFIIIQSIFFLGAIYFKKNNFMKTVATLIIFWLAIAAYIRLLTWPFGLNHTHIYGNINNDDLMKFRDFMMLWVRDVGFYTLFGPFMLLVSYFRLKERQI